MTEVLKALSDPTRQKIYRLLLHEELCVCELAAVFQVSQSAISQHLRRLKAIDLVSDSRRGQWVFYRARFAPLERVVRQLGALQETPLAEQSDLREQWVALHEVKRQNLCSIPAENRADPTGSDLKEDVANGRGG